MADEHEPKDGEADEVDPVIIVPDTVAVWRCEDGVVVTLDEGTEKEITFYLMPSIARLVAQGLTFQAGFFVEDNYGNIYPITIH